MSFIRPLTLEEFSHQISGFVLPIFGFSQSKGYVAGTAVMIAPSLALTASHVLAEIAAQFGQNVGSLNLELDIYIVQPGTGACWYVIGSASWVGSDITILTLKARNQIASEIVISQLTISVDPPALAEEVSALGYPNTGIVIAQNDSEILRIGLAIRPTISVGKVIEVHADKRDSVMLPFPCFAVDSEFSAGMSGGAVFNARRELCGLVCSGGKGDLQDHSYAASVWPMAIIPVVLPEQAASSEQLKAGERYKVLQLAQLGAISLLGHERLSFFTHENGSDGIRRHHPVAHL